MVDENDTNIAPVLLCMFTPFALYLIPAIWIALPFSSLTPWVIEKDCTTPSKSFVLIPLLLQFLQLQLYRSSPQSRSWGLYCSVGFRGNRHNRFIAAYAGNFCCRELIHSRLIRTQEPLLQVQPTLSQRDSLFELFQVHCEPCQQVVDRPLKKRIRKKTVSGVN